MGRISCATQPEELPTTYVSPTKYKSHDCEQVAVEMGEVSRKTAQLYQSLDTKADNDAAQLGVGLIIFWPMLFALEGGDGPDAVEYSNLKGEYEALKTASVSKECSMDSLPPSPEEIIAEKQKQQEEIQKAQAKTDDSF
ncbi:MAG: metal ABC transporter ATP-binding protein [Gammaproteobacteria bacterium]